MGKKSISSLELTAIVNELQILKKGKVSQIYHQDEKEFLLQLHAPGYGKQLLKVFPGKFLCVIPFKEDGPLRPSGFCMQLRKYLKNAFIADVYQKDSQRIVVFNLEKEQNYHVVIELFSKGNIVLTDENWKIITCSQRVVWKDRTVKPGETYQFPAQDVDWKTVTKAKMLKIISSSEKKNLATTLATEVGLGGVYAEEICTRVDVSGKILPDEVIKSQSDAMWDILQEFMSLLESPKGYVYEKEITPFALQGQEAKKETKTYNEALSRLNPYETTSPYEKRIKAIEKTIATQEGAIEKLHEKVDDTSRKGELIYEKYAELAKLQEIVDAMKKEKSWDEVKKELLKNSKIQSVNLKKKSVVIDL